MRSSRTPAHGTRPRPPRPAVAQPAPVLPPAARVGLAAWVALLVLAPPTAPAAWAVNGLRAVGPAAIAGSMAPRDIRFAVALALALGGVLEAFAGYAESAPLLLAAAAWWWWALARPHTTPGRAATAVVGWLAVALAHRSGLVLLLPQLLRGA